MIHIWKLLTEYFNVTEGIDIFNIRFLIITMNIWWLSNGSIIQRETVESTCSNVPTRSRFVEKHKLTYTRRINYTRINLVTLICIQATVQRALIFFALFLKSLEILIYMYKHIYIIFVYSKQLTIFWDPLIINIKKKWFEGSKIYM